ncbi:MAG: deoxynucleoside kinase [Bacteroidota bacterium]
MTFYKNIAIEGNIGAGKTTLATKLAKTLNANLILEEFSDNPFLPKFYINPKQYAFPLEISFLIERYDQLKMKQKTNQITISDYFFSKTLIFAKNNLDTDEYQLFEKTFKILDSQIAAPDLIIYLYLDVNRLQKNIKTRGREYEQNIKDSYLESLQNQYIQFLKAQKSPKIIILDINTIDFVGNEKDFGEIVKILE